MVTCWLRITSLFSIVLWVSWTDAPLAFRDRCFGDSSVRWSPKSYGTRCGIQTLHSSGRSKEVTGWHCARGGDYGESVSQSSYSFQCGYFRSCLMCRSHSASFWICLRGNCFVRSYPFGAPVGGGTFRSLLRWPSWSLPLPFKTVVKCSISWLVL